MCLCARIYVRLWGVVICKTTLEIQICAYKIYVCRTKGVTCISKLESYADSNLAALWATCVRQVSSELLEIKGQPGPAEIGSWG